MLRSVQWTTALVERWLVWTYQEPDVASNGKTQNYNKKKVDTEEKSESLAGFKFPTANRN